MVQLHVDGMSCGHCIAAVTKAVQALDAAAQLEIDLSAHSVRVDSSASIKQIVAAIEDAGYSVTSSGTA
jgi:copper chaperone